MSRPLTAYSILVVEDEGLILMMIEDLLAESGCESITTAATVETALALIGGQHFDAAMLDLNLRGGNSYGLADELIARGIPFFFSTGNCARDMMEGYRNYLALRKPFQDNDLVRMFTRILE